MTSTESVFLVVFTVLLLSRKISDRPCQGNQGAISVVGEVQLSPESEGLPAGKRKWTAPIEHWSPFDEPVAFKAGDGTYVETGTDSVPWNYWRDGVREISRAHFLDILLSGGSTPRKGEPASQLVEDSGQLQKADKSLITPAKSAKEAGAGNGTGQARPRRSKQATIIGNAAEKLFYDLLSTDATDEERKKIRWVAKEGITPGYDIQDDRDPDGIIAYEVKGTTGKCFASVDITVKRTALRGEAWREVRLGTGCRRGKRRPDVSSRRKPQQTPQGESCGCDADDV